ncbi:MAG: hypothetical protein JXA50_10345 [Deltaproteobacteria bacterium]|nr:hypothetical protein [Deltaproteobacteria bacterium]
MARAKKASTRRKTTRKPSTKRASTKRSSSKRLSTKRPATRKASTRRTSASRKKRSASRARKKSLLRTRKREKKILIIVAVIVALVVVIGFLQNTRTKVYQKKAGTVGEVSRNAVEGRVTSVNIGVAGRGTIRVKSFRTGKTYTFYTGVLTKYNIKRYPRSGDSARVSYVYDRGYLKATYVRLR